MKLSFAASNAHNAMQVHLNIKRLIPMPWNKDMSCYLEMMLLHPSVTSTPDGKSTVSYEDSRESPMPGIQHKPYGFMGAFSHLSVEVKSLLKPSHLPDMGSDAPPDSTASFSKVLPLGSR